MKRFVNMESLRITSILVLLYTCSISSFPSRPLNERSADLAWQAWLLVDDQNQEKNYDPEFLGRKKITPKSVFIAPTFSPESLPACANGYQSDSMGRCVKLIEIDREAHLEFLLQKLNERFASYEDVNEEMDEVEEETPEGPLQVNIPLGTSSKRIGEDDQGGVGVDDDDGVDEGNVNVAIVVTPTNGKFLNDKETEEEIIEKRPITEGENFNDLKQVSNSNHENFTSKSENFPTLADLHESTTITTPITKSSTDPEEISTIRTTNQDKTLITELNAQTTTTEIAQTETVTDFNQQALFFREPSTSSTSSSSSSSSLSSTSFDFDKKTTNFLYQTTPEDVVFSTTEKLDNDKFTDFFDFKTATTTDQFVSTSTEYFPVTLKNFGFHNEKNSKTSLTDEPSSTTPLIIDDQLPYNNLKIYAKNFGHIHSTQKYVQPEVVESKTEGNFVFKNRDVLADAEFQRSLGLDPPLDRFTRAEERPTKTRRNIDRNKTTWFLAPADINGSSPQKPLVFKFPNKNFGRRLLSESALQPQKTVIFRKISPDDHKILFGNHRHKKKYNR